MTIFNGENDRANALRTGIFCVLAELCEGIDLQAAGVAAPGIVAEFHPSPAQLGNFLSASPFGLFVGALIGGRLADRIGRKGVVIVSNGLFWPWFTVTSTAFC